MVVGEEFDSVPYRFPLHFDPSTINCHRALWSDTGGHRGPPLQMAVSFHHSTFVQLSIVH